MLPWINFSDFKNPELMQVNLITNQGHKLRESRLSQIGLSFVTNSNYPCFLFNKVVLVTLF